MIVFKGDISQELKNYLRRWESSGGKISGVLIAILGIIADVIIAVKFNLFIMLFIPVFILCAIFGGLPRKNLEKRIPKKITINNRELTVESDTYNFTRKYEYVKSVVDYGRWYKIIFYYPYKNGYFICQKDLLIEGSFAEFEKLFNNKIKIKRTK